MNLKINMPNIDLNPQDWNEVCHVLRAHVPEYTVWAFGSRVKWTAKAYSDLDLAIITQQPLSLTRMANIKEAFDESNLSIRVDIVDWATTSEAFRKIIEQDKVVVQKGCQMQSSHAGRVTTAGMQEAEQRMERLPSASGEALQAPKDASTTENVGLRCANPIFVTKPLGEIVSFKTGKLDSNASENNGKYPFFTCSPITLRINSFAFDTEAVILAGNNANGVFSTKHYSGKFNAYQRTYVIEPLDPKEVSCRYIYFVISHMVGHLKELAIGTSTKFLTKTILNGLPINLPSKIEQEQIAEFLSSLDDRITLLRETNTTLEAIAQALFKSWFVDFDPVHAKQQGLEPEGIDAETAALFPDSFEESELGLVPIGWAACSVYDLATYINGAAYKAFDPNLERRGLPIIKIAELKSGVTAQTAYSEVAMPEKYRIQTGDILFSWSGNPDTSIDTFVWIHDQAWLNQHIFRVLPKAAEERSFLLQTLKHLRPVFAELARNKQTTGLGHVTVSDLKRLQIIKPERSVLKNFDSVVAPIHDKIFFNEQKAQTLATLRDTLLPRLISGQLRLPDAEALSEEASA